MDRLISADALMREVETCISNNKQLIDEWFANVITDAIDEQPTVDAVPVVRCKECKYSEPSVYPQAVNCTVLSKAIREWVEGYGCPTTNMIMTVFEDHYCGWGERK